MTVGYYRIRLRDPAGNIKVWCTWAVSATNAHWMAAELHPGYQVEVLGLEDEW
jgi:hypothetical protein